MYFRFLFLAAFLCSCTDSASDPAPPGEADEEVNQEEAKDEFLARNRLAELHVSNIPDVSGNTPYKVPGCPFVVPDAYCYHSLELWIDGILFDPDELTWGSSELGRGNFPVGTFEVCAYYRHSGDPFGTPCPESATTTITVAEGETHDILFYGSQDDYRVLSLVNAVKEDNEDTFTFRLVNVGSQSADVISTPEADVCDVRAGRLDDLGPERNWGSIAPGDSIRVSGAPWDFTNLTVGSVAIVRTLAAPPCSGGELYIVDDERKRGGRGISSIDCAVAPECDL